MVDISTLSPGDVVKIVDQWGRGCCENPYGLMDHWLGKTMTVRKLYEGKYAYMEEDKDDRMGCDGWHWFADAIDYVVLRAEDIDNIDDGDYEIDDDEIMSILEFARKDIWV